MEELEVKNYLAAWADIISLLLTAFALAVAGVDSRRPRRFVWGRSLQRRVLIILALSLNIIFSAGRLIAESVLVETGPREFLVVSVVYCARWIWVYWDILHSRSGKAFTVALQLRWLKTIRLGRSSRRPGPPSWLSPRNLDSRSGERELVIRRGKRTARGTMYWRGVEEDVRVFTQNVNTWPENLYFVRLVEPQLHSSQLDVIGTSEFKEILEKEGPDGLYKIIYELVMTCDSQSSELQVDYSPFLNKFGEVRADTATAIRVGATSNTVLGDVARRVAADACYYVFRDGDVELRAGNHVRCINDCIENAAKTYCLDTGAIESDSIA